MAQSNASVVRPEPAVHRAFFTSTDTRMTGLDDDWDDLIARIERTPKDAQIRGMFLREVLRLSPGPRADGDPRYVPFSLYPVREYMGLLVSTARAKYPKRPPADALLELGLGVYSLFAQSIAGTAIFAVANVDFKSVCELSPKAYNVTLKPSRVSATDVTQGSATMQLRDVWVFPEIFHTGIWLGAMEATKVRGTIEVCQRTACDVDLHIKWQKR